MGLSLDSGLDERYTSLGIFPRFSFAVCIWLLVWIFQLEACGRAAAPGRSASATAVPIWLPGSRFKRHGTATERGHPLRRGCTGHESRGHPAKLLLHHHELRHGWRASPYHLRRRTSLQGSSSERQGMGYGHWSWRHLNSLGCPPSSNSRLRD
jgi:hypothetical protein